MRKGLRDGFFRFLRKVSSTDDARKIQAEMLRGLLHGRPRSLPDISSVPPVYPGLGGIDPGRRPSPGVDAIFITGRFRSGSTLLWNIFRNIGDCTAYYEPLNERRWFDSRARGSRMDESHRAVTDYWREYEGLEELGDLYRERWIDHDLLMHPDSWEPDLKRYLEVLIDRARGRPVLQFNRVDFRLPWLRSNFPGAKIVHLYRHPRDQWCSTLGQGLVHVATHRDDPGPAGYGQFYLTDWATDLKYHFPFLDPALGYHPYQTFYFVWLLSYAYGKKYSDESIGYEELIADPRGRLAGLLQRLGIDGYDPDRLEALIIPPPVDRWKQVADDEWFRRLEVACEAVLADFFAVAAT